MVECSICDEKIEPKNIYWYFGFVMCKDCYPSSGNKDQREWREQHK